MKRLTTIALCFFPFSCTMKSDLPGYAPQVDSGAVDFSDAGGPVSFGCGVEPIEDAGENVSGRWALLEVAAGLAKAPAIVDPIPNQSVFLELLRQTQEDDQVSVEGEYCDHWVRDPEAQVHTLIPDAYKAALQPFQRQGTVTIDRRGRMRYNLEELVEVVGAELEDERDDPLPVTPDDPRVVDHDADGKPGMTVRLGGLITGDVYVVDRRIRTVDVVAVGADRFKGGIQGSATQSIIASDPAVIKDLSPEILADPDPCRSSVEIVKVPDDADCTWIRENVLSLFPDSVDASEVP